jgi:hypothetical protein
MSSLLKELINNPASKKINTYYTAYRQTLGL